MCFFCELSKCVWILYYEMCYHCLRVSESCITKYAITAYVCLNLVRQNVLLLSTCVESCMKIVLLLSTCVESCMTKCAIPVYVCWILYDKMCYCCLRVLNLVWQNVLLLSTCVESSMTKCAITAYLYLNLSGRKNFRCRFRHLRYGIHNVWKKNQWLLHSLHPFQFSERCRSHICHRRKYFF